MSANVRGRLDAFGALVSAEPRLLELHLGAGGRDGGPLAVPAIADIARLARRLGVKVSRPAIAAEGANDLDLWVEAVPVDGGVSLEIAGWTRRPAYEVATSGDGPREEDFFRAAADWRWETDDRLRLTALSPAAAGALGSAPQALVGEPLTRLFRFIEGDDGSLEILSALAERRRFEAQIAEVRDGDGSRYRLAAVPMTDGQGRFGGFRGAASRLGLAPEPPAEALGARMDEALRLPLARIVETADELRGAPLNAQYSDYAADIASAGRHLLSLVEDLVDLAAIERADFAPAAETIDLAEAARSAAGLLAVRANAGEVRLDPPAADEPLAAKGEFRRVLQILVNLIGNAVRYSPPGSMVWIRADREGDAATITVADQGKGIAPEDQARIFEKFERVDPAEPGGTGLGLYISRRLARAMGGDITLDSAPGQGARFKLRLPA